MVLMRARRLRLTGLVSLCVSCAVLVLTCASAQATVTHDYLSQITEVPAGPGVSAPGPLGAMESMSVDSGHLWIAEVGSRADEFDASTGAFVSQLVPTKATPFPRGGGIAVGHATGQAEIYAGAENESGGPVVAVFSEAGTLQATWTGADVPGGSFGGAIEDVAVDNSTSLLDEGRGEVYVAVPSRHVIDVFHPEAGGKEKYVTQLTGISPSEPFQHPSKVDVNEANGDVNVLDPLAGAVDVFEPTALGYVFVRKIPVVGTALDFAVDGGSGGSNGEIYVPEGLHPTTIGQFSSTGAFLGRFTGVGSPGGNISGVFSLAVDPASHDVYVADYREGEGNKVKVFGPSIVVPDVTTGAVANLKSRSATLAGTVNPHKGGAATCQFVWGATTGFGHVAPCSTPVAEGESPVPVQVSLSGLEPDTNYCYRLQASNAKGTNLGEASQDQCFTTPGPGLNLEAVSESEVTAESAIFDATINPHGSPTSYYFQYGATSGYGTNVPALPGASVGSGEGNIELNQTAQGLQADTVYHYRLVVLSEVEAGNVEEFVGPDHAFTTQHGGKVFALPDGRRYEMVTPPQKQGSLFKDNTNIGTVVQASVEGNAIVDEADQPTEPESQGDANAVAVLSTRGPAGWASQVIAGAHNEAVGVSLAGPEYQLFSEDLSHGVMEQFGNFTPLSPEATESTPYLRTDYLNGDVSEHCESSSLSQGSCFQPLVTRGNTAKGVVFGDTVNGICIFFTCGPQFIAGTPDLSHVIVASRKQLTSTPATTGPFTKVLEGTPLYEWYGGQLQLLNIMPGKSEGDGNLRIASGNARRVISNDGGRVILENGEGNGGGLYLRNVAKSETIPLNVAEPGCGACAGGAGAEYMTASSDGSRIFFTDTSKLTSKSSGISPDLYECEVVEVEGKLRCNLSDLTPESSGESANVNTVVGASEDGSYVYFVAGGALAAGAARQECVFIGEAKPCNLYVRHAGMTRFIAKLSGPDWGFFRAERSFGYSKLVLQHTRVSSDGRWLAFMSNRNLTGYDTRDAATGSPDEEVYLYDASSSTLACASCNPTGARPVGVEPINANPVFPPSPPFAAIVPGWEQASGFFADFYQPRYLSNSGRLFFDSTDALVPRDVNGGMDVYQYEPEGVPAGEHACTSASTSGSEVFKPAHGFEVEGGKGEELAGCVGLISSGTAPEGSTFLDASETGGDVFFLTTSKLAPQDFDHAYDVYDAHECMVASPCPPVQAEQPPPCATEGSCRAAPAPQPSIYGAPSSATFNGAGNLTPTTASTVAPKKATKCGKRFVKKKGRCVKRKSKSKAKKARRALNDRRSK